MNLEKFISGVATDGRLVVNGAYVFNMKARHGLPFEFIFDYIINTKQLAIDWTGLIDCARLNKWWDFQTYDAVANSLVDAEVDLTYREEIKSRCRLYIMKTLIE